MAILGNETIDNGFISPYRNSMWRNEMAYNCPSCILRSSVVLLGWFWDCRRVQTFSLFQWRWRQVRKTSPNRFKTNSTYSNKVSEFHFSFFIISSDKANFLRNKATPIWTLSKPRESFSYAILPVVLTFNKRSHIAHGFDTGASLGLSASLTHIIKLVLKTRFQQQQQLNFSLPLYNDLIDKSQNSGNFCLPEISSPAIKMSSAKPAACSGRAPKQK